MALTQGYIGSVFAFDSPIAVDPRSGMPREKSYSPLYVRRPLQPDYKKDQWQVYTCHRSINQISCRKDEYCLFLRSVLFIPLPDLIIGFIAEDMLDQTGVILCRFRGNPQQFENRSNGHMPFQDLFRKGLPHFR